MSASPPDALVVTELFPPAVGGSGFLLREIYRRFAPRRVTVLTDRRVSAGPDRTVPPAMTIERIDVATDTWGVSSLRGSIHHLRLAGAIRRGSDRRRTVVHCARALPEGVAAWLSHAQGGPPYVCWGHGEDITMARTSREQTWVMSRVFRSAAAVIANSRNTQASILSLGIDPARTHIVYPGVDPERFSPAVDAAAIRSSLLGDGDVLLLSVGRLHRRKGHDVTIEALAVLGQELPGLRYAIVGDGDRRAALEALASERGVAHRVTFCGAVAEDQLPALFAAGDIFVLPNRQDGPDIEGFGIVFLEAAAAGLPTIGGASGGVPEAIENGLTGLLVDGTDVRSVAAAIAAFARDPDRRRAYGRAGRARVLDGFTWDRAASRAADLHDRVRAQH